MKGIIWYIDKNKGEERMKQLIGEYQFLNIDIDSIKNSKAQYKVQFKNNDFWQLIPALDSSRGNICNISLVQKEIPKNVINEIILPCTKSKPYRAIGYY